MQQQPWPADCPVKCSPYQPGIYVSMCSAIATFTDKTIYLSQSDGWGQREFRSRCYSREITDEAMTYGTTEIGIDGVL